MILYETLHIIILNITPHGLAACSTKSQREYILGFAGHVVSVTTIHLCSGNVKQTSVLQTQVGVTVPIKLYVQNQTGGQAKSGLDW